MPHPERQWTCKNKIKYVTDIHRHIRFHKEVMPSTHKGQVVLYAELTQDDRNVVVKIREKDVSFKDQQDIDEWRHTMEIFLNFDESFRNDYVAKLSDCLEDGECYYQVMEEVQGPDLFEYLQKEKHRIRERIYEHTRQVASEVFLGLLAFHSYGLIHKDIKLENIVLDEASPVKGSPFPGVCKLVDFDTVEETWADKRCCDIMGTDQYIAPEAYLGYYSPASDVFAVGVVLYKLLTGNFPYHDEIFDDGPGENFVGHPKMKGIRCRLKLARIDWSHPNFRNMPECRDFVKKCLVFDETKRMTSQKALEHRFLFRQYATKDDPGPNAINN